MFPKTGNHDYYSATIDRWIEFWTSQGLMVLHNRKTEIKNQNEKIYLAGIDDTEGKVFRYVSIVISEYSRYWTLTGFYIFSKWVRTAFMG